MGLSFLLLVSYAGTSHGWRTMAAPLVLGLGPLVRPDLAIFSAVFLGALFLSRWLSGERAFSAFASQAFAAALLPVGYEIFRMGYFAALVPNTALAKEAGSAYWSQGLLYAQDFVEPYQLWRPLAICGLALLIALFAALSRRDWSSTVLVLAPVVGAALSTVYIVRVGGDFMHARMLLPAYFGALLPISAIVVPLTRTSALQSFIVVLASVALLNWAVSCVTSYRLPYSSISANGISDERNFYVGESTKRNPVTAEDYERTGGYQGGAALRAMLDSERRSAGGKPARVLLVGDLPVPFVEPVQTLPLADWVPSEVEPVAVQGAIGVTGYVAGPEISIIDVHGLSDPLASRAVLHGRGRPGHEKDLEGWWFVGRFADPATPSPSNPENVVLARRALSCGALSELRQSVEGPLSPARFVANVIAAPRLSSLRVPGDPGDAENRFCGSQR